MASTNLSSNSPHMHLVCPVELEEGGQHCILMVAVEDLEVRAAGRLFARLSHSPVNQGQSFELGSREGSSFISTCSQV